MANSKNMIRIRLKAYDHQLIDKAAETIVEAAQDRDRHHPARRPQVQGQP